ncbi:type I secretion protein TolC [Halopseudomonas bauzanensis]|uniref:Type I secretion protein TolC n=1 Tax=Halopseudomonas bauzanensis TaxID=653930 RepID=A0A4U0YX43_9GAMM|nr:type I secretion protein TolC [Halopseudomonas bauzanensis]
MQLADAVRSALNEHPAIAESLSRLDAQQEQVSVARAGYWPQLRGGINTGYRHTTGRSEEALTLSASQMLYDFGKVSSAVEAAASGVDREEASVLLAAEDLIRETTQAFIEARRYEELLELATAQIEAIGELEALAAKRSALGASSVSDQMQAQSRREAARAVQLQMQAQRDQWHSALEKLIGSSQGLTLDEAYPQPLEGLCPRLPENFDSAPRVVIAEAERAEAEAAIRQARAEQRPTLSLNADFEHYLNRNTEGQQQLDDQELVVSLNLTSNLFQGGALRARSRAAEHALQSASAARDRALLELSRFYREARDRSRSLTTSLALQDERYASIVKTQELYRHQYLSLGTRSLLDILNTEQEIFQTQVDKQNTLFDLRSLQIDCLYSVGGLRETFRAGEALNHRVSSRITEVRS